MAVKLELGTQTTSLISICQVVYPYYLGIADSCLELCEIVLLSRLALRLFIPMLALVFAELKFKILRQTGLHVRLT